MYSEISEYPHRLPFSVHIIKQKWVFLRLEYVLRTVYESFDVEWKIEAGQKLLNNVNNPNELLMCFFNHNNHKRTFFPLELHSHCV